MYNTIYGEGEKDMIAFLEVPGKLIMHRVHKFTLIQAAISFLIASPRPAVGTWYTISLSFICFPFHAGSALIVAKAELHIEF